MGGLTHETVLTPSFSLKYMYEGRKMSHQMYVLEILILPLFLRIFIWILELFQRCSIFFYLQIMLGNTKYQI